MTKTLPFKFSLGGRFSNDCQISALSNATGISYDSAYDFVVRQGWSSYHPLPFYLKAEVLQDLLEPLELPKEKISTMQFIKLYPVGRYICRTTGHVFAIVNGIKIDYYPINARINAAWKVRIP